ncbi:MAG: 2-amino-4-hydroxy-6-hydroxymethyldihydropteridine diphosphokinase [Bacteroidales bacterium]|jgi:2-amino-4-hydroxy-6-hydroxymethyldihydropteridine diphosphokinase|nr:2-amino-4-hydroxy-6-hydroxymethyldihydropteridine diphosphokinase [Bacteroidales bacterium]MDD2569716.1 2-amino-4-hydroxy-6-hydroxymethyldihydropteridine diphosphokinase [Bacteroidales bacterium]MDD2811869.1 2-amino-4-hydroxy-6-hydroxymethyldihydropteridine diphosphokinase [Bacteroidales bacterium]MDD3384182.1 2-amino-4-hydroxy-6-hydroxymethyldihydropteridine diphosphokinase [Bacteroidales bacterium]MDD3810824.1 2-amino-4-hydroxy-6-hydroxymethyldihydropteridine diphosphokinase [Bacteroidales
MKELVIGLGSNLGNREWNISEAIRLLSLEFGPPLKVSSLIETEPWGFNSDYAFLNAVALFSPVVDSEASSAELLAGFMRLLFQIEAQLGRNRTKEGYADRTIDLDLLFYGDTVLCHPELTVPHPLLHKRGFVLIPLMETCPDLVHPVLRKTTRELLETLNTKE